MYLYETQKHYLAQIKFDMPRVRSELTGMANSFYNTFPIMCMCTLFKTLSIILEQQAFPTRRLQDEASSRFISKVLETKACRYYIEMMHMIKIIKNYRWYQITSP